LKDAVAYYNDGVVAVNLKVVGLAPGIMSYDEGAVTLLQRNKLPSALLKENKSHII
jgi:hypothetical protein